MTMNVISGCCFGGHGGQHRVVLVVVLVHAVATDQIQVRNGVDVVPDLLKAVVDAEVGRVGLCHADHHRIARIGSIDDVDLRQFLDSQLGHLFVRARPELIAFIAEVLGADPHLRTVGDQERTPVIEDLQPPHEHVGLLNVDPVVGDELASPAAGLAHLQFVHQHAHGDKVAVLEFFRHFAHIWRHRAVALDHCLDELFHRCGREEIIAGEAAHAAVRSGVPSVPVVGVLGR